MRNTSRQMTFSSLQFGALSEFTITADEHPNEMKFRGVLVRLDEPSTKPPNGSDGHRIQLSTAVAKTRLKTLVGMGLNYAPSLDTHAQRRKVGVIKRAWIEGSNLCVSGVIWKHDFPEASKDLKQAGLGMSMELGKVRVRDMKAQIWHLDDFYFLGATILKKNAAAYYNTEAIAAKASERSKQMEKTKKSKVVELTPELVAKIAAKAAVEAVNATNVVKTVKKLNTAVASIAATVDRMDSTVASLKAKGKKGGDDEDENDDDEEEMDASEDDEELEAGEDDEELEAGEDDEEEIDATEDINEGDLERVGPKTDDDQDNDDNPGHMNKGAANRGNKTTSMNKLGKHVDKGVTSAALSKLTAAIQTLTREALSNRKEMKKITKRVDAFEEQAKKVAAATERRSAPAERSIAASAMGILAKANIDVGELQKSGRKLTVAEVDGVLAQCSLDAIKRIEFKNGLVHAGLMEEGA